MAVASKADYSDHKYGEAVTMQPATRSSEGTACPLPTRIDVRASLPGLGRWMTRVARALRAGDMHMADADAARKRLERHFANLEGAAVGTTSATGVKRAPRMPKISDAFEKSVDAEPKAPAKDDLSAH